MFISQGGVCGSVVGALVVIVAGVLLRKLYPNALYNIVCGLRGLRSGAPVIHEHRDAVALDTVSRFTKVGFSAGAVARRAPGLGAVLCCGVGDLCVQRGGPLGGALSSGFEVDATESETASWVGIRT